MRAHVGRYRKRRKCAIDALLCDRRWGAKLNDAIAGNTDLEAKSVEDLVRNLDSVPEGIRGAVRTSNGVSYPRGSLANQLKLIAKMIRGGLRTRVFYASIFGLLWAAAIGLAVQTGHE